ncbi:hypothetical protein T484DRAFT_2892107 [Baffinella frigidus]|nr:hypothetical protein T484DRAFT_2892107 [Cryptophyta sp. CCMP2293]
MCVQGLLTRGEFTAAKQAVISSASTRRLPAEGGDAQGGRRGEGGDVASGPVINRGFGEFSVLNPSRNATAASVKEGGASLRGMVPIFDINRFAKAAGRWLHRRQQRLPMLVHTPGESYDTRYKFHAFSGYEVATVRAAPAFTMAKKSRLDSWLGPSSDAPGPGEYDLLSFLRKSWVSPAPKLVKPPAGVDKFTPNQDTALLEEAKEKPGPGAYLPQEVDWTAPSTVFGTEEMRPVSLPDRELASHPGPNAYIVEEKWGDRGVVFGTAEQRPDEWEVVHSSMIPGPGAYPLPDGWLLRTEAVASMGAGERTPDGVWPGPSMDHRHTIPGPGAYDADEVNRWGEGGAPFGTEDARPPEWEHIHLLNHPAPNAYDPRLAPEHQSHHFSKADRVCFIDDVPEDRQDFPGVGTYDLTRPLTGVIGGSRSARRRSVFWTRLRSPPAPSRAPANTPPF